MQTRFAFAPATAPVRHTQQDRRVGTTSPSPRVAGVGAAPHDALIVLDIETVPDAALISQDRPVDRFPKNAWHKVVAISFVTAEMLRGPDGREEYTPTACRSGGEVDWGDREGARGHGQAG